MSLICLYSFEIRATSSQSGTLRKVTICASCGWLMTRNQKVQPDVAIPLRSETLYIVTLDAAMPTACTDYGTWLRGRGANGHAGVVCQIELK